MSESIGTEAGTNAGTNAGTDANQEGRSRFYEIDDASFTPTTNS